MISFGREVRVFVATQPIDFRQGVHGLVALVAEGFGGQPYSGDVFVFRSKRSGQVENPGLRRIRAGAGDQVARGRRFRLASCREGTMRVTGAQLAMLIEGLSEWSRVVPKMTKRPTKVA